MYGTTTLADVEKLCTDAGAAVKAGESIGAVFNPGAFTHTSAVLHDAIEGASLPVIESHISNVHKREAFRHHSFISSVVSGIIVGFGIYGYVLAIHGLHQLSQAG